MSNTELFIDGVINVSLVKGLVRIDLYSLSATEQQPDGSAKPEFRQRLVLHPTALPDIQRSLQYAVAALRERGLLAAVPDDTAQPQPVREMPPPSIDLQGAGDAVSIQPEPSAATRAKPRSPNFPATMTPSDSTDAP